MFKFQVSKECKLWTSLALTSTLNCVAPVRFGRNKEIKKFLPNLTRATQLSVMYKPIQLSCICYAALLRIREKRFGRNSVMYMPIQTVYCARNFFWNMRGLGLIFLWMISVGTISLIWLIISIDVAFTDPSFSGLCYYSLVSFYKFMILLAYYDTFDHIFQYYGRWRVTPEILSTSDD